MLILSISHCSQVLCNHLILTHFFNPLCAAIHLLPCHHTIYLYQWASAVRFDALLYGIELAYLMGNKYGKARKDLLKKVRAVAGVDNIPQIKAQEKLLNQILHTDYLETAGVDEFEHLRSSTPTTTTARRALSWCTTT